MPPERVLRPPVRDHEQVVTFTEEELDTVDPGLRLKIIYLPPDPEPEERLEDEP